MPVGAFINTLTCLNYGAPGFRITPTPFSIFHSATGPSWLSTALDSPNHPVFNMAEGRLPSQAKGYLQNDVIEPDQVLRPGRAFAVIFWLLLQQGPVQAFRHVLIPPDGCGQLDVGQVAARYHMQLRLHSRKPMFWESTAVTWDHPGRWG